jgi:lysophospholipase L1-like esterase
VSRLARPSALAIALAFVTFLAIAGLLAAPRSPAAATAGRTNWITTWASAPQAAIRGSRAARGFESQTLREIVVATVGGDQARIELSNAYGSRPLTVGGASIATLPGGTPVALAFAGQPGVVVPPGASVLSDPLTFTVAPFSQLALSVYLPVGTGPATENADAEQTAYAAPGDATAAPGLNGFTAIGHAFYYVTGLDVSAPSSDPGAIAALGDSITDGVGSNLDAADGYPADLARRLPGWGVFNAGIGGNRVLNSAPCCGVDAVARFERDVASHAGVRAVILLEGINDIGFSRHHDAATVPHTPVSGAQIIAGDEMIIALAHADGLKIYGATLTPFRGARYWSPAGEAVRDAVNAWILQGNRFDGVIDFATVLADPSDPQMLDPTYDSGDHLHPNAAGYERMAQAIDLTMIR